MEPKSGTVVLIHGLMRTERNMSGFYASFLRSGWSVETWSYPSREKLIEEHARDLVDYLKTIAEQKPGKPISFVTHSMGGLILRTALNLPDCPIEAKLGRAVLVAPPNRGSIFARRLHRFPLARQLLGDQAGNQLMTKPVEDFRSLGKFPEEMPVLVISGVLGFNPMIPSANDGKVALSETTLDTPHYHLRSFSGHSWICHSPTVIWKAKRFLSMSSAHFSEFESK